jgi:ABC-2 type transport system ATP-binding protein
MQMDSEAAISTRHLQKRYGRQLALDGLDLTVTRGEVFGFLGPNGAGKSTTIRILLGLLRPTSGHARLLGRAAGTVASRANGRVGALVEEPAFYEYLSGRRNLELLAALSGPVDHRRIEEVLELVGLRGREKDRVGTYSHGMKQRLGIAQALIPRPELLVLDEPASGLDPQGVVEVRDLIQRVNAEEHVTVFVSSHHLHEIELTCTDAAIINRGKLVVRDKVKHLLSASETAVAIEVDDPVRARQVLTAHWDDLTVQHADGLLRVTTGGDRAADINAALVAAGLRVSSLQRERPSLEDLYLRMMR